jgi:hypothetical protein
LNNEQQEVKTTMKTTMDRKQIIISAIVAIGVVLLVVGSASAATVNVLGSVRWSDGTLFGNSSTPPFDYFVITNNNNGQSWNQTTTPYYVNTQPNSANYALAIDDTTNISTNDILQFNVSGTDATHGTETNTTASVQFDGVTYTYYVNVILDAPAGPDLTVSSININSHISSSYDDYYFANESNRIYATITNSGGAKANASVACFNVSVGGGSWCNGSAPVKALNASESDSVYITDPTLRQHGDNISIKVTADCTNNVTEGVAGELNNVTILYTPGINHGQKSTFYTTGQNMSTWRNYTLNGCLVYSMGNSYYKSGSDLPPWTAYDVTWTAKQPGVPAAATVKEARLYMIYTWEVDENVIPGNVSLTFNGNLTPLDAHYEDRKGFGTASYDNPYGMLAYNVTADYNKNGVNTASLTNSIGGYVSMRGAVLMLVYENPLEPVKQIFINEGFDYLYGNSGATHGSTCEEATAWADIGSITVTDPKYCARLVTIAPGADAAETGSADLIFNTGFWADTWNFIGSTQIGCSDRCVTNHLDTSGGDNRAGFQSNANYMEASNAFLIVTEGADACVETATKVGCACFSVDKGSIEDLVAVDPSDCGLSSTKYPFGLFSFNITGLTNGGTVNVTITLPANLPAGSKYWKVDPTCGETELPLYSDDGDNVIMIRLTDGDPTTDEDGTADGQITDDSGPAMGNVLIAIDQPEFVDPQSQFTINITVDPQGNEVSAVQYDLYYNTSVVWAEWANPGTFLNRSEPTDVTVRSIDNTWNVASHIGKITYAETTLGNNDSMLPSVNTPGVLTTIHFSAIGERGTYSVMNIEDVMISDPEKQEVLFEITDCGVTIYDNIPPVAIATSKYRFSNVASKFQCFAAVCCCNSHGGWENNSEWKGNEIVYVRWDFGDGNYGTSEGLEDCQKHHEYTSWNWNELTEEYDPFIAYLTVRDNGEPQLSNTTDVEVMVYIAGDTNGDGVVDILDAACVGKHYGQNADNNPPLNCTPYWTDPQADKSDLNNDNRVTTIDLMIVGTNWNHAAWPPYYIE